MSLCRPLISYVHVPKFPHCRLSTIYIPTEDTVASRIKTDRPNVQPSGSARNWRQILKTTSPVSSASSHMSNSLISAAPVDGITNDSVPLTVEAYKELRYRDRISVANLSDSSYLNILTYALKNQLPMADWVVLDILEVFQGGSSRQDKLLQTILSLDFSSLSRDVVLRILQRFSNAPDGLGFLTTGSVERLARMASRDLVSYEADGAFLRVIHPILRERIRHLLAPGGVSSVSFHPPGIIYAAFRFVRKMLALSLQQQALEIFQCLVDTRQVPAEAMHGGNSSSDDFNTIISRTLARASLHWNWRNLGTVFLTDILDSSITLQQSTIDLNLDVIYALLDTPTRQDIRACGQFIRRVHHHVPVPNSIIRQFYDSAAEKRAAQEAEDMYSFTRSPSILRTHHYPPPQGVALPWLMLHLTSVGRRTHLSRVLASEVVDDNLSIPLQNRARFIAATAAQGYGTLSRNLWERYAIGKYRDVIIGDPALMIRMVSLFTSLSKRASTRYQQRKLAQPETSDISSEDDERLRNHSDDLTSFLHRILLDFKVHHEPLTDAPHRVLTSLARAYFIIGKFPEGFECFSILSRRRELPDLYDVNVALSALAQLKPRLATKMIERMEEKGLRPDTVSYGTVMHHALRHRDKDLVNDMIERIRDRRDKHMTPKSMASLIRAGVTPFACESKAEQRRNLEVALHLIESFPQVNIAASPQIGKYLVFRSLHAEGPALAYKFWTLCLKKSTEWHDREQRFLRLLIAQLIRKHRPQLDNNEVATMLFHLGHWNKSNEGRSHSDFTCHED